jgi:hypothetical protein
MTEVHLKFGEGTGDGTNAINDVIVVEPASTHLFRLHPAAGGAEMHLRLKLRARPGAPEGAPYDLQVMLFVGRDNGADWRLLCDLSCDGLAQPGIEGGGVLLKGFVGDAQLLAVEELRAGGDVGLRLQVSATRIGVKAGPRLLRSPTEYLELTLAASDWLREWRRAQKGSFVELLLPLTGDPAYVEAVRNIVKGRELIQQGNLPEAVLAVRPTVELVRDGNGSELLPAGEARARLKTAKDTLARNRTREQRWLVVADDVFSLLSGGGAHPGVPDDWSREETVSASMIVGALLNLRVNQDSTSADPTAVHPLPPDTE